MRKRSSEENSIKCKIAFSQNLRSLIKASGKDIKALALDMDVALGSLSKYQKGITEPGLTTFKRIAEYFNVSYDFLLGDIDNQKKENVDIGSELGLSDVTISLLREYRKSDKDNSITKTLNALIENRRVLNYISKYLFYTVVGHAAPFDVRYINKNGYAQWGDDDRDYIVDPDISIECINDKAYKRLALVSIQEELKSLLDSLEKEGELNGLHSTEKE